MLGAAEGPGAAARSSGQGPRRGKVQRATNEKGRRAGREIFDANPDGNDPPI